MVISDNDWRLHGQERYLSGITLYRKAWTQTREHWDHDHCMFCNTTFATIELPDALHEGYTDQDEYYWICEPCFVDFKEHFNWTVADGSCDIAFGPGNRDA